MGKSNGVALTLKELSQNLKAVKNRINELDLKMWLGLWEDSQERHEASLEIVKLEKRLEVLKRIDSMLLLHRRKQIY